VSVETNPAYRNLKAQQQIVEGAIEHMAVIHCADLNGSVIQVGRVSRQFRDAVAKVRDLRRQVAEIQGTLGAASSNTNGTAANANAPSTPGVNTTTATATTPSTSSGAMSLRELWLKKLECEAVLALLDRLDIIRAAPSEFDILVRHCRIGAGVLTISRALATMFSDDIAQVQALHKIMEQLLLRKQKAEEMVWETFADVVFLRTGNGLQPPPSVAASGLKLQQQNTKHFSSSASVSSQHSRKSSGLSSNRRYQQQSRQEQRGREKMIVLTGTSGTTGNVIFNPFGNRFATDDDGFWQQQPQTSQPNSSTTTSDPNFNDADSVQSQDSGASLFSLENQRTDEVDINKEEDREEEEEAEDKRNETKSSKMRASRVRMMIPIPLLEAELDLENDERRCLEEVALSGITIKRRPKYADPVLALRILVECCRHLGRLDDVERVLAENLSREIRTLVQRENTKTFRILQQRNATNAASSSAMMMMTMRSRGTTGLMEPSAASSSMWSAYNTTLISPEQQLQDFRRHLTGLLSAFGCVLLRLAHLAEVLRIRIVSRIFGWTDTNCISAPLKVSHYCFCSLLVYLIHQEFGTGIDEKN
jgi:hypothetical protein